jgi:ATP synthase protein I
MGYAAGNLDHGIRRVVLSQALLALGVAAFFLFSGGGFEALSAGYGGATAVLSSWWLARRVRRSTQLARADIRSGQISMYFGAAQRFVAVLALLGIGIGALRLAPLPLIIAFAVAQLGFLVNPGNMNAPQK